MANNGGDQMEEARKAAQFLVDAYENRRPTGDAEPYALIVARALLAMTAPSPAGEEGETPHELAARIVAEYTAYDWGMAPANELKLARALLLERARALEEAARYFDKEPHREWFGSSAADDIRALADDDL